MRPARRDGSGILRAMERLLLVAGAISAAISVAAGAFGAHALKARLAPDLLAVFHTGAQYQMYHALGLLAAAWASARAPGGAAAAAGWLFILGTVLFSGSLYALARSEERRVGKECRSRGSPYH